MAVGLDGVATRLDGDADLNDSEGSSSIRRPSNDSSRMAMTLQFGVTVAGQHDSDEAQWRRQVLPPSLVTYVEIDITNSDKLVLDFFDGFHSDSEEVSLIQTKC
ncbi:hypothetical protein PIB30_023559 [Stylosanthes scabra]|uniref:Uncharacterized protein n=1 Tax=Stylosanthes scabra TaxID=79078 RepID=A0ABU6W7G9_9FABA|nr:hypothetical protein [Stylosanthes scabra]